MTAHQQELTTEELRERIATALRVRHATDRVIVECATPGCAFMNVEDGDTIASTTRRPTEDDALMALAVGLGLNSDGTDPRAEVERLRRDLAEARAVIEGRFGPRTQDGTDPRCSVEAGTRNVTYCARMQWMLQADDRHFRVGLRVPKRGEAYGAVLLDVKGKRYSFCDYCPFCGAYIATVMP